MARDAMVRRNDSGNVRMAARSRAALAAGATVALVFAVSAAVAPSAQLQRVMAARDLNGVAGSRRARAAAARPVASTSGGTCLGLRESHCEPCPAPEQNDCERVKRECDNLLCSPLCLDLAWNCTVTVDAGSPLASALTASERSALCAQVVAEACSTEFGCCAKDDALYDWVERYAFLGQYPAALVRWLPRARERACASVQLFAWPLSPARPSAQLPIAPCLHDPRDKVASDAACNKCKAALGVKLAATKERCAFGGAALARKGGKDPAAPGGSGGAGGGGTGGDGPSGGAHKSFEERCDALAAGVETRLAGLVSKLGASLCKCAGCCDPPDSTPGDTCFFPLTIAIKR